MVWGVPVTKEEVLISSDALVNYMQAAHPASRLFVLGTPALKSILQAGGFSLTMQLEESADYVVVGFDQTLTYQNLAIACRLIDKGVPFVATHPDVRCPIEGGGVYSGYGGPFSLYQNSDGKRAGVYYGEAIWLYGGYGH